MTATVHGTRLDGNGRAPVSESVAGSHLEDVSNQRNTAPKPPQHLTFASEPHVRYLDAPKIGNRSGKGSSLVTKALSRESSNKNHGGNSSFKFSPEDFQQRPSSPSNHSNRQDISNHSHRYMPQESSGHYRYQPSQDVSNNSHRYPPSQDVSTKSSLFPLADGRRYLDGPSYAEPTSPTRISQTGNPSHRQSLSMPILSSDNNVGLQHSISLMNEPYDKRMSGTGSESPVRGAISKHMSFPTSGFQRTLDDVEKPSAQAGNKRTSDFGFGGMSLIEAIQMGEAEILPKLLVVNPLERDALCNNPDMQGNTALHMAASQGNAAVVGALLPYTRNINLTNSEGYSPLHIAVRTGNQMCVNILLNAGVDVSLPSNMNKVTPLHLAAAGAFTKIIQQLVECGADVKAKDAAGDTPLHVAAKIGHVDPVNALIRSQVGASAINARSNGDVTPLLAAVRAKAYATAQALIEAKADLNAQDSAGQTPLMEAVNAGSLQLLRLLLRAGADVNRANAAGETPLMRSITSSTAFELVRALTGGGADVERVHPDTGLSPLMMAASKGSLSVLSTLIANGAQVDRTSPRGHTALMLACQAGSADCVSMLLSSGADKDRVSSSGETALMLAAASGSVDVVTVLLESCCNVDCTDSSGLTAADYATKNRHDLVLKVLSEAKHRRQDQPDEYSTGLGHSASTSGSPRRVLSPSSNSNDLVIGPARRQTQSFSNQGKDPPPRITPRKGYAKGMGSLRLPRRPSMVNPNQKSTLQARTAWVNLADVSVDQEDLTRPGMVQRGPYAVIVRFRDPDNNDWHTYEASDDSDDDEMGASCGCMRPTHVQPVDEKSSGKLLKDGALGCVIA